MEAINDAMNQWRDGLITDAEVLCKLLLIYQVAIPEPIIEIINDMMKREITTYDN